MFQRWESNNDQENIVYSICLKTFWISQSWSSSLIIYPCCICWLTETIRRASMKIVKRLQSTVSSGLNWVNGPKHVQEHFIQLEWVYLSHPPASIKKHVDYIRVNSNQKPWMNRETYFLLKKDDPTLYRAAKLWPLQNYNGSHNRLRQQAGGST